MHYWWTYHIVGLIENAILHLPMLTWITKTPLHVSFSTYTSHCMPTWITDTLITFIKSYVSMLTWINKAPLYPNFYLTHADEGLCTTGGNFIMLSYIFLCWLGSPKHFWFWLRIHANLKVCWPLPPSPTALCWLRSPPYLSDIAEPFQFDKVC